MKSKKKKKIDLIKEQAIKVGYTVILSTILVLGISYAWLSLTLTGNKSNTIQAGTLSLVLDDTMGEGITMENGIPMYDTVGLTQVPYTFTLTNDGTVDSEYTLYLDDMDLLAGETRLPDGVIKYNLTRDEEPLNTALLTTTGTNPNRILDTGIIAPKTTYTYHLRLWLDENMTNEDMNKVFRGKIRVVATQTTELDPTFPSCFAYTKTGTSVTITGYKCYKGNLDGLPVITDVIIPKMIDGIEVTSIGDSAFSNKQLTSVNIPDTVTNIGTYAFNLNKIKNLIIPNSVNRIEYAAFRTNQLTNLVILNSKITIVSGVFNGNQLPDQQAFIYKHTSNGIDKTVITSYGGATKEVTIPFGVKVIDYGAFRLCDLTSVNIPNSVTSIGSLAFMTNQLTSITIPASVTTIESQAFDANQLTKVIVKGKSSTANFTTFGTSVFGWASGYNDSNITWQP